MQVKTGKFTIKGYSVAGKSTCIIIPELKLAFDMGIHLSYSTQCEIVCISHGHADHIGALHMHTFDRRMSRLSTPTYIMPPYCVDDWLIAHDALKKLNKQHSNITRQFSLDTTGDFSYKNYQIRWYDVIHRVPCKAYTIYEVRKKLKTEFINLDKQRLIDLKKVGKEITETIELPIISFTGDTTIEGVLQHPNLLESDILIMECSFLFDIDYIEASKKGHICASDIVENASKFCNKYIVLTHISAKYSKTQIRDALQKIRIYFPNTHIEVL